MFTMQWSIVVSRHFNTPRCFKSSGMSQSGLPTIVAGTFFFKNKSCQPHGEVKSIKHQLKYTPKIYQNLTWQWKHKHLKMYLSYEKNRDFHCHVSFRSWPSLWQVNWAQRSGYGKVIAGCTPQKTNGDTQKWCFRKCDSFGKYGPFFGIYLEIWWGLVVDSLFETRPNKFGTSRRFRKCAWPPKLTAWQVPQSAKGWNAFLPEGEVNVAVGYQEVVQKLLPNYGGAFIKNWRN